MTSKLGCFRPALLGCLGVLAILVLGLAIISIFAARGVKNERMEDRVLDTAGGVATVVFAEADSSGILPPGRVILDLSQGEFYLHPGEPGAGVVVKARFDQEAYELADGYEVLDDGSWTYRVRYQRTIPGLQAVLQALFGGSSDSRVDVYLPPDVPIALELSVEEGASEVELGGLWLTDAQVIARKGGFSLRISDPLREPLESLTFDGAMGGLDASGLGNASPRNLSVSWRMGGADIGLSGQWLRDCDARVAIDMGGMSVSVPREVVLEDVTAVEPELRPVPREGTQPVIRLHTQQKRGEVDVVRR